MSDVERGTEGSGEKLLVVDDDPFIARLLEIELAAAGYQVRVANDGQQAMDQVGQDAPDLVITDVMMPHVDGFELTRSLRQDPRTATISVIILTARGLSADKLEGFAIGADDYIVKPFDTPELLARVRGVLRRKREMKDESPLTGLPGNNRVQEEIEGRVASGDDFALLLVDASAVNVVLIKRFFDNLPREIFEAAKVDGAGPFRLFCSIVLPMSRPILGVVSVFAVIATWKDYLWPLLVIRNPDLQPLSVRLPTLQPWTDLGVFIAALTIARIFPIVLFLIFQRLFLSGGGFWARSRAERRARVTASAGPAPAQSA